MYGHRFIEAYRHQLAIVGGGVLSLRAFLVGPVVVLESHPALTWDVTRAVAREFHRPVFTSGLVRFVWGLFRLP